MERMKLCLIAVLALLVLQGCAFTTEVIDIQYEQQQGVVRIPGADAVTIAVNVEDNRQDKSKVSSKKNGYGMETAPILSREDVSAIIARAISQEAAARGFKVAPEGVVLIDTKVNRFYNDHKIGFFAGDAVADLDIEVAVMSAAGKELYMRGVAVQGKRENTQLATGNNASIALGKALVAGMEVLFSDEAFISALASAGSSAPPQRASGDAGLKSKSQLLDELASDTSISYDEYQRRHKIIMRQD